jgi:hypothetical protein
MFAEYFQLQKCDFIRAKKECKVQADQNSKGGKEQNKKTLLSAFSTIKSIELFEIYLESILVLLEPAAGRIMSGFT